MSAVEDDSEPILSTVSAVIYAQKLKRSQVGFLISVTH